MPAKQLTHISVNVTDLPNQLSYRLEDRPKGWIAFLIALQHLLAMIVPIVTPGLLICKALNLSAVDTNLILSMSLLLSGVATWLQCRQIGAFGAGLLICQGTSFNFVTPIIASGSLMLQQGYSSEKVLATIFGVIAVSAFVEIFISRILGFIHRLITPLITGIVVLLIGLVLIKEALISMGGGFTAIQSHQFGSPTYLLLSLTVLAIIILLNRSPWAWLRSASIVIALLIGYLIATLTGLLNFNAMHQVPYWQLPQPLHFGLSFSWSLFIPLLFIYVITSLEAIGDITATSKISHQPISGKVWLKRIKGGVLVNGCGSLLAGLFNTFPSSIFAQNNGVIQITGVASRHIGTWIALILVALSLFPKMSAFIQAVPEPVLGAATLVMFGSVAASGINILASSHLDRRALLIIAIALAIGLGINQVPEILAQLPTTVQQIFVSGTAAGGLTALLLNLFLPNEHKLTES